MRSPKPHILRAQERIRAGRADREAGDRYRRLAAISPSLAGDYLARADECDRIAATKLRSSMAGCTEDAASRFAPTEKPKSPPPIQVIREKGGIA
jgi:hypothetical protein